MTRKSASFRGILRYNESAPTEAWNSPQGLTHSSDYGREGLAMKATRNQVPTRRSVNPHAHPDLIEAVAVSRFWRMVSCGDADECWPWTGDVDRGGYGIFTYHGTRRPAHEMALSFTIGEKRLDDMDTCHSCDNPPCCNPAHLRFGTRQSNVDDMVARGRHVHGEKSPNAKLTTALVRELRLRRAMGALQRDLALDYGISAAYVSEIVNGLVWQDAGGPITGKAKRTKRNQSSRRGKVA